MGTWNNRVIRREDESGEVSYQIHEVFYGEDGEIENWTREPVRPSGKTLGELREDVRHFLEAFGKEVLEEARGTDGEEALGPSGDQPTINDGHYFEAMDRAWVALSYCQEFVGSQPVIRRDERLRAIFERAEEALAELYQAAGDLHWGNAEKRQPREKRK